MQKNNIKGCFILTFASLIWGLAFVVQNDASNLISPFAFNSSRSLLGALVIFIFLFVKSKLRHEKIFKNDKSYIKSTVIGGIVCGIFLAFSVNFQQLGISVYPDNCAAEARAGFITALYVILVPIVSITLKKKTPPIVWLAVMIALLGIYYLCLSQGLSGIYLGDILMLFCALSCTIHILFVDKFGGIIDGPLLSFVQFLVCGIISGVISVIFEPQTTIQNIYSALPQILYMGILSSGLAYTLQIIGQRYAEPAVASIFMSLESVFASLGGWIIMGNKLSPRELLGCALVFVAIIIAQIPEFFKKTAN